MGCREGSILCCNSEHYDIYLYADNLFDEEYNSIESDSISYSPPREIGIQLTYRF